MTWSWVWIDPSQVFTDATKCSIWDGKASQIIGTEAA